MTNLLATSENKTIVTPSVRGARMSDHIISYEREYIDIDPVPKTSDDKIALFDRVIRFLASFSKKHADLLASLPHKSAVNTIITFPIYLGIACLKNPKRMFAYIQLAILFIRNIRIGAIVSPQYVLTHRDLTSENILRTPDGLPAIIDVETAIMAEKLTDLSLFPRFYMRELKPEAIRTYLSTHLYEPDDIADFIRLTIYYSIQMLCIEKKNSEYFEEAELYIDHFLTDLLPYYKPSKSWYEILVSWGMRICATVNTFGGNRFLNRPDVILCYHSISTSSWRFALHPQLFEVHIRSLKEHYDIVSLKEFVTAQKTNKPRVVITFDDAYADNLSYAAPILKRYNATATMFAIGGAARKYELDNELARLSVDEMVTLRSEYGWEIGYHTRTHANLFDLSDIDLAEELSSKESLIESIVTTPRYLAYPKGHYSNRIVAAVRNAGYEYAFTVDARAASKSDPYRIARICVERGTSASQLLTLTSSLGLLVSGALMALIKLKYQVSRRLNTT